MDINKKSTGFFKAFIICLGVMQIAFALSWLFFDDFALTIFFGRCQDIFMDYFNVANKIYDLDPYKYLVDKCYSNYPALAYLIVLPFSLIAKTAFMANSPKDDMGLSSYLTKITPLGMASFILYTLLFAVLFVILVKKYMGLKSRNFVPLIVVLFLSYPLLFSLERGNMINYTFLLTLFFIVYYDSGNKIMKELALVSLACAFATKFYPLIFAVLLIKKGRLLPVLRLSLYSVLAFIVPFLAFKGGFYDIAVFYEYFKITLGHYSSHHELMFLTHNYSLDALALGLGIIDYGSVGGTYLSAIKIILLVFSLAASLFIKKEWKTALILANLSIFIPTMSYGYILLFYIIPLLMFLKEKEKKGSDLLYFIMFLFIFMPLQLGVVSASPPLTYTVNTLLISVFCIASTASLAGEGMFAGFRYFKQNSLRGSIKNILDGYLKEFKHNE